MPANHQPDAGAACRHCGTTLAPSARHCQRCGTSRRPSIVAWVAPLAAAALLAGVLWRPEPPTAAPTASALPAARPTAPPKLARDPGPPAVATPTTSPAPPLSTARPADAQDDVQDLTVPPPDLADRGCVIKATYAEDGSQVYRLPETIGYAGTPVDTAAGDRWYCEEEEAIEAGFGLP